MQLIANFIKLGVPLKESLVFALKRKREGSRSNLLLYTGIEVHTVEGLIDLPDGALERVVLLVAKKRGVTKLLLQHIDFLHSVLVGGVKGLLAYSIAEKYDFILCFARFTLPFNKVGCTREYKTKLRICFDIPLICTTFAAVECVFAYRCLFPYLTKVKLDCTRKRKQVFFSLVSTSFAVHLQHAHADGLLNNG